MSDTNLISSKQIKAARAILDWSQDTLAEASSLSIATIRKLEAGSASPRGKTNSQLKRAIEHAGLEFIHPNGVRERPEEIKLYKGVQGIHDFFNDVYDDVLKYGGDIVCVIQSERHFDKALGNDHDHIQKMNNIETTNSVKCLITDDHDYLPASGYCEYRWLSTDYVDAVPFYIYNDNFAIITFDQNFYPRITVIHSAYVSDAYRRQFYSMWNKSIPLTLPPKA